MLFLTFTLLFLNNPPGAPVTPANKSVGDAATLLVVNALNAKSAEVDACTARYAREQPEHKGIIKLNLVVQITGKVKSVQIDTALPQARDLKLCIERIAKAWSFPKPKTDQNLSLSVPVFAGAHFQVPRPGEKKEAQKPSEEEDGFVRWLNQWNTAGWANSEEQN